MIAKTACGVASLPPDREMYRALVRRDAGYDGIFYTAVKTTGVFCRPTCPARKPKPENIEYYATPRDALFAGYRPCKRCRPLQLDGDVPPWLQPLLDAFENDLERRWTDADVRAHGLDPARVRRWFKTSHGMTFHAYQRARRLGLALGRLRHGADLTDAAYDAGFESLSGFRDAFKRLVGEAPGRSRDAVQLVVNRILTPLGPMVAGATDEGLCLLEFADRRMLETQFRRLHVRLRCAITPGTHPHIAHVERELHEYFEGRRREFTVPLVPAGTEFQQSVWKALQRIPYGAAHTYEQQARAIGRPTAVRAVGRANGDNRIAVIIPCHRVVGSDGKLTGYGGGLWRKQYLLDLERRHAQNAGQP